MSIRRRTIASVAHALLAAVGSFAFAQSPTQFPHPVRTPFVVDSGTVLADQFALASDGELTVLLYVENNAASMVRARRADGRGLASSFTLPESVSFGAPRARRIRRDSLHVIGNYAFALWLEDEGPGAKSRLYSSRFVGTGWSQPLRVDDSTFPANQDILDFACSVKTGPNGSPYVAIAYHAREGLRGTISLLMSLSVDGGISFHPPLPLAAAGLIPGGVAEQIGGVAVELKGAEMHVAWTDDRANPGGFRTVFYRRAILDWFGNPLFLSPLGTGAFDIPISFGPDVVGSPVLGVDDDPFAPGGFAKYVGIGWRELDKGPGFPTLYVRSSPNSGNVFLAPTPVGHTSSGSVAAGDFDLEILGGDFIVTWEDNTRDLGNGAVAVLPVGQTQVWRAVSEDGTDLGPNSPAEVEMLSAFTDPSALGRDPQIARAGGFPDGAVIAFVENSGLGNAVRSSFADQSYGSEWHLDDYPRVSADPTGPLPKTIFAPRCAYNARYDNFLMAWQQELNPESGIVELWFGGYRPPQVEIAGWKVGSFGVQFRIRHVPFQDSFAFVMLSGGVTADPVAMVSLPDGRRTGLLPDVFYAVALQNWSLFLLPIDPLTESAESIQIPLPPGLIQPGFVLTAAGVTWGPGGALHVLTDFIQVVP